MAAGGTSGIGVLLCGLTLRAGNRVLCEGLSLRVEPGEFLAIAGPSGSGKTTLLYAITGQLRPEAGEVEWFDAEGPLERAEHGHRAGFVYQHLRLPKHQSACDAVCCGRLRHMSAWQTVFGFARAERERACAELARLGLRERVGACIRELSGGERQRVAIARALNQEPDLYCADEPVANLDRTNAQGVLARLRSESVAGKTVIAVLHDETQIGLFADRVLRWDSRQPALWKLEEVR